MKPPVSPKLTQMPLRNQRLSKVKSSGFGSVSVIKERILNVR